MDINTIQDQIIADFSLFDEWMDKYAYLIELGNGLETYDDKHKTEAFLISGCQSRVWVFAEKAGHTIKFTADSDAIITKGIIALLIKVLSNQSPETIQNADLYFIEKIGLQENLSPTRANGLLAMIKQMKYFAFALSTINAD